MKKIFYLICCVTIVVLQQPKVFADEDTSCPKASTKESYEDTVEENVQLQNGSCLRTKYKEKGIACYGKGFIECCPGVTESTVLSSEVVKCP